MSSRVLYNGINERIERMTKKFHFIAVKISVAGLMIPPLMISYTNYYVIDLKTESFQLPYDGMYVIDNKCERVSISDLFLQILGSIFRYPFEWRTPIGYLIALLSQSASSFAILYSICPLICFIVGTCWLLIGCSEDISNELPYLNTVKTPRRNGYVELKEHICSIAKLSVNAKEFSAYYGN